MAIQSMDALVAALPGQHFHLYKTTAATVVAANWHTLWDRPGRPGPGTLSIGNTTSGVIPTQATVGALTFTNAAGGQKTYLGRLSATSSVVCTIELYDRVWHAGSFSCAALTTFTLTGQPALTRFTTGEDVEIWLEINTAMAASATTVTVTYTNSQGVAGRTSGVNTLTSFITGRMVPCALQAGDTGVQKIESVIVGGVTNTGTFNVVLVKALAEVMVTVASGGAVVDPLGLGLPEIPADACLALMAVSNTTNSGVPNIALNIVTG
jgi:hypothetical protein